MKLKINNKYYDVDPAIKDYIDILRTEKMHLTSKHASLAKTNKALITERTKNNKPVDILIELAEENRQLRAKLGDAEEYQKTLGVYSDYNTSINEAMFNER